MRPRDGVLWAGILVGPVVCLTSFLANFAVAPWTCVWRGKTPLYGISILALLITLAAGLGAWKQLTPGDSGRVRLMAFGGIGLSTLAALVILAQGLAEVILSPCD